MSSFLDRFRLDTGSASLWMWEYEAVDGATDVTCASGRDACDSGCNTDAFDSEGGLESFVTPTCVALPFLRRLSSYDGSAGVLGLSSLQKLTGSLERSMSSAEDAYVTC